MWKKKLTVYSIAIDRIREVHKLNTRIFCNVRAEYRATAPFVIPTITQFVTTPSGPPVMAIQDTLSILLNSNN